MYNFKYIIIMETKEQKLAQVDELVKSLGLTRKEAVDYLDKLSSAEKKENSQIREERRLKAEKELEEMKKMYSFYDKLHTIMLRFCGVLFFCMIILAILFSIMFYFNILSEKFILDFSAIYGALFTISAVVLIFVVGLKGRYDLSPGDPTPSYMRK